jgi:hypothetical protein
MYPKRKDNVRVSLLANASAPLIGTLLLLSFGLTMMATIDVERSASQQAKIVHSVLATSSPHVLRSGRDSDDGDVLTEAVEKPSTAASRKSVEASTTTMTTTTTILESNVEAEGGGGLVVASGETIVSPPKNLHKDYGFACGEQVDIKQVAPSTIPLFEMVYGYNPNGRNGVGHRTYAGPMENGVRLLARLQVCSYAALQRFRQMADEYNITHWSGHGGTLMAAVCHGSMNPWDDDIDITVSSCEPLERIYAQAGNITERYPDMPLKQHTVVGWEGRLLDSDWIIIKGSLGRKGNWYKLKSVAQITAIPARDLAGMDIMCFDNAISRPESGAMERSGFRASCKLVLSLCSHQLLYISLCCV